MLKIMASGIALVVGLLGGSAWADETLDKALLAAVRSDAVVQVMDLLDKGADANARDGKSGYTALHIAAINGFAYTAKLLLRKGADVNARTRDDDGATPLHLAVHYNKDLVTSAFLVEKGADVNAYTKTGGTALLFLILNKNNIADRPSKEFAELLFAKGANLNAKSENGATPLFAALISQKKELTKFLIRKGASVNTALLLDETSGSTWTALDAARDWGDQEIIDLLVAKGAKK